MKNLTIILLLSVISLKGQVAPELYLITDAASGEVYHSHIKSHDNKSLTILQKSWMNVKDIITLTNFDFCDGNNYLAYQYELNGFQTINSRGLAIDSRGNFYITGWGTHPFIMKVKKDFNPDWCYYFEDSVAGFITAISINSHDELLVTGYKKSANSYSLILKIDTSGNVLKGLKLSESIVNARDNLATSDGGWLLISSKYLIKIDADLKQQWVTMINQNLAIGSSAVETKSGYFMVFEKFSTDQIIGVFIDKKGKFKWDTGLLENHYFGEPLAPGDESIILLSNKYSGNSQSIDFAKQACFVYNTKGQLKSYTLYNQEDGYLTPHNTSPNLIKFNDELLFSRSIGSRPSLPYVRTAIGPVHFNDTSSGCLKFFNNLPNSLPFVISMQTVPSLTTENFTTPMLPVSVSASNYFHDSIIQMCPRIYKSDELNFQDTIKLCYDDTIIMNGLSKGAHYWSTGETSSSIEIFKAGKYFLEISDPCGQVVQRDSFIVEVIFPEHFVISGDTIAYTFDEARFSINQKREVQWFIDNKFYQEDTTLNYSFNKPGIYQIHAIYWDSDLICRNIAKYNIEVRAREINFPNVFTPNEDGINDNFKSLDKYHTSYSIEIYNRYGVKIAAVSEKGWDGFTTDNKPAAEGVYYYLVNIIGKSEPIRGFVTLIR